MTPVQRSPDASGATPGATHAADAVRVAVEGDGLRGLYDRGLTWVSVDPMAEGSSRIAFATRRLPDIGLICGTLRGVRHNHTRVHTNDNDDFSVHFNLSGRSIVTGRDREVTLRDGDAVLLSYAEPRRIARPDLVRYAIARLPRALLAPLVRNIDDAVMRPIPRGAGALALLTNYVGALVDDPALAAPDMRRLFLAQLCDLVAVTIGATADASAAAEGRGLRAARLRAIKDDIEAHLDQEDLSPAAVARRQKISDSYMRKLFESEGTSFSAFVLGRRLARAHRMLANPRLIDRSIASIAYEAGFGDLSYFNRTFRRAYGATPSELREGRRPPAP